MSAYIHDFSYTEDDILTSDRLLEFSRVGSVADYIKIDYFYWGCRPIYWRGGAHPTCPPQRNILITGHGDFPITKDVFESARTHIPFKKWFGTNVEYDHPDLKPIHRRECHVSGLLRKSHGFMLEKPSQLVKAVVNFYKTFTTVNLYSAREVMVLILIGSGRASICDQFQLSSVI